MYQSLNTSMKKRSDDVDVEDKGKQPYGLVAWQAHTKVHVFNLLPKVVLDSPQSTQYQSIQTLVFKQQRHRYRLIYMWGV